MKKEGGNGEAKRRREFRLLILKHVQQRLQPWALVSVLSPFSRLGDGPPLPFCKNKRGSGGGAEEGSARCAECTEVLSHTHSHKIHLRGRSCHSHPTGIEAEADRSAFRLHEVGSDSKTLPSPQPQDLLSIEDRPKR